MTYFWLVLAILFFALATVNCISSRNINRDLKILAKEGPDLYLNGYKGRDISVNQTVYKAFKITFIIETIGFILASIAAIISFIS